MLRKITTILLVLATVLTAQCTDNESGKTVTITFAGDVLLDRGLRPIIERDGVESLFGGVREYFQESDYTVINLECPISEIESPINKKYIFRADTPAAPALQRVGITHCAMANNHTVDQGITGLRQTFETLKSAGIVPIGYIDSAQISGNIPKPVIISKNGVSVAVFSVCALPIENYTNSQGQPGICIAYTGDICDAVRGYKAQNPLTYVVLFLHWGTEFQPSPSMGQRIDAMRMVSAGADVIIGCHPHVVQNVETVQGRTVYYSIGNFVFDQRRPEGRKAIMPVITFGRDTIIHRVVDVDIVGNKPVAR